MTWNYDKSRERVQKESDGLNVDDIELEELKKTMDLENLSIKKCRWIYGAHLYTEISNFDVLLSDGTLKKDSYARLIKCLHVYQKEVSRIVENIFDGVKIHFQGSKLHALFYRPINDSEEIAIKAALCSLLIEYLVRYPLHDLFDVYKDFRTSSGIDIGKSIGTKNGTSSDRELLFLGDCANQAAKIMDGRSNTITATDNFKKLLPEEIRSLIDGKRSKADLEGIFKSYDVDWDYEKSFDKIGNDKISITLADITVSGVTSQVNLNSLSIRNNKKFNAVTFYADVSGFTRLIKKEQKDGTIKELIKVFHIIRKEMREVIKTDFGGTRIQYQGDRIQGIFYLPQSDEEKYVEEAVKAAFALQSSFESVLCDFIGERNIHVATGLDLGLILLSKTGKRGNRDVICMGKSVTNAARLEHKARGKETAISQDIFELLSEDIQALFPKNNNYYVAINKTYKDIDAIEEAKALKSESLYVASTASGIVIKGSKDGKGGEYREVRNVNPWWK